MSTVARAWRDTEPEDEPRTFTDAVLRDRKFWDLYSEYIRRSTLSEPISTIGDDGQPVLAWTSDRDSHVLALKEHVSCRLREIEADFSKNR